MADALRLITHPLPVAAGLGYHHLSAAVGADALARRAWAVGRPARFSIEALAGDLGGRLALDRELVRQGHTRTTLTPDELDEAARTFEAARREAATEQLASIGVAAEFDVHDPAGVAHAAEVAFVRLYDEGLLTLADVVVPSCPSCATVIEGPDAVPGELEVEALHIRLEGVPGDPLVAVVVAPELMAGTVAVGVPVGHPAAGGRVRLPLADREVSVVEEPGSTEPRLLVPAHDAAAYEVAKLHGFVPRPVIGADAVVLGDGPIGRLSRFAAREAARALLEAEGVVLETTPETECVVRCRHCGSVAAPVLDTHWMLDIADIEVSAADVIRHGAMSFVPGEVRDAVLSAAGGAPWCLDRTVPGALRIPVATCGECRRVTVAVGTSMSSTCGKCFGELEPSARSLDSRFVAALWPLVRTGWPGRMSPDQIDAAARTVAVVAPDALEEWALPAVALGLHLARVVPFGRVVVQPATAIDPLLQRDLIDLEDVRVARLALLTGAEFDAVAAAVAALDRADGDDDAAFMDAVEAALGALDEGWPERAAALLMSVLGGGVPAPSADRVRALAVPFLGS